MEQQTNTNSNGWGIETFIHKLESIYNQYIHSLLMDPAFFWFLLAFFLIGFWVAYRCRRNGNIVKVLKDGSGQALISKRALLDLVNLTCMKLGTPSRPKISFRPRRNSLDLLVKLKLYEAQKLGDIRTRLHNSIVEALEQTHGINIGKIDVLVVGFKKGGDTSIDNTTSYANTTPLPTYTPQEDADTIAASLEDDERDSDDESATDEQKRKSFFSWTKKNKKDKEDKDENDANTENQ